MAGEIASRIGANFSDYVGNAALGGAGMPEFKIDTKPLELLSQYTYLYNKSVWEQTQKETDAKIKQLADLSTIHLNDLRAKDKEYMTPKFAELIKHASDYASKSPKNAQEKMQNELDWQTQLGAFKNDFDSGKVRSVTYEKEKNDIITKYKDAALQDVKLKQLDKKFDDTEIGTPMSSSSEFTLETPKLPEASKSTAEMVKVGGDQNAKATVTYFGTQNADLAATAAMGLHKTYVPKTIKDAAGKEIPNPTYEALSQNQKDAQDQQATQEGQAEVWAKNVEPLNAVIAQFTKDGVFDEAGFRKAIKGNRVLEPVLAAVDGLNKYASDKEAQKTLNTYKDEVNGDFSLPDSFHAEDFSKLKIDLSKGGITSDKLVLAGMYGEYAGDKIDKTLTETGKATQVLLEKLGNTSAEKINANTQAHEDARSKAQIDAQREKWKAETTGSETEKNGAMVFAKNLFNDLKGKADKYGVLSPEKIRLMNVEQRKYLGLDVLDVVKDADGKPILDANNNPVTKTGLKPLELGPKDVIQLVGDEVRVLRNAEQQPSGSWRSQNKEGEGGWDNTRSTNITNIATNRINEQNKNSTAGERQAYVSVDIAGSPDVTSVTKGGGSSASGSTSKKQISRGAIADKAAASGYTPKEYEELLKKKGVKITD